MLKMAITQFLPRHTAILSYVLSIGLLLIFAGIVFSTNVQIKLLGKWNLYFGIFLIIFALILIVMMCMYSRELKFQGYMLQYAVIYLDHNPITFIAIPIFFLLHLGLIVLVFWQYICFSSDFTLKNIVIWKFTLGKIFNVLTLIEYLWGLQFLRDSCTYFSKFIKSTFVFQGMLWIGIGQKMLIVFNLIKDLFVNIGAVSLQDHF